MQQRYGKPDQGFWQWNVIPCKYFRFGTEVSKQPHIFWHDVCTPFLQPSHIREIRIVSRLMLSYSVASITCILIAGVMAKRPAFVNLRTSHNNIQYMINSNGFWDDNRNVFAVMGLGLSTLFTMLAVIWQQVTAKGVVAMAESMEGTHPSASAGVSSMALGLGAFGLAAATTFVMSIGIKLMQGRRPAGQNVEMASGYTCPVHGITGV